MDDKRSYYLTRYQSLKSDRSTWDPHWQEVAENMLPRKSRFVSSDVNKGTKRNDKIINATPTRALRVCVAGVSAGTCSPARPWFKFGLPNKFYEEDQETREWLFHVENIVRMVFARTNLYNALISCIENATAFGTEIGRAHV